MAHSKQVDSKMVFAQTVCEDVGEGNPEGPSCTQAGLHQVNMVTTRSGARWGRSSFPEVTSRAEPGLGTQAALWGGSQGCRYVVSVSPLLPTSCWVFSCRISGGKTHRRMSCRARNKNQERRWASRLRGVVEESSTCGFSCNLLFQLIPSFWDSSMFMCLIAVHSVLLLFFIFHCGNGLQLIYCFPDDGNFPMF